jgi:hypothetical protein
MFKVAILACFPPCRIIMCVVEAIAETHFTGPVLWHPVQILFVRVHFSFQLLN